MTTVLDMMKARGEKEPETQDEWKAYRDKRAERRQKNYDNAITLLRANRAHYAVATEDDGRKVLFVAKASGGDIKYYPEEGKWYDGQEKAQYGIKNLIRFLRMEV